MRALFTYISTITTTTARLPATFLITLTPNHIIQIQKNFCAHGFYCSNLSPNCKWKCMRWKVITPKWEKCTRQYTPTAICISFNPKFRDARSPPHRTLPTFLLLLLLGKYTQAQLKIYERQDELKLFVSNNPQHTQWVTVSINPDRHTKLHVVSILGFPDYVDGIFVGIYFIRADWI